MFASAPFATVQATTSGDLRQTDSMDPLVPHHLVVGSVQNVTSYSKNLAIRLSVQNGLDSSGVVGRMKAPSSGASQEISIGFSVRRSGGCCIARPAHSSAAERTAGAYPQPGALRRRGTRRPVL